MRVRVRVFGQLKRFLPDQREDVIMDLEEGTTVLAFLRSRQIPDEQVWIVTINGKHADEAAVLRDGDELCMFSPVGGG